ncbi:hypothetical protein [Desulfovibrio piger]|uniref:hypothetical protein n=1 Tax=Desulfovibrio piger TaxID=901 RepID=UPI0030785D1D
MRAFLFGVPRGALCGFFPLRKNTLKIPQNNLWKIFLLVRPGQVFAALLAAICARIGSRKNKIKAGSLPLFLRDRNGTLGKRIRKTVIATNVFPFRNYGKPFAKR